MLPKTSTPVKSYDGQTKWMYIFDMILFGKKTALTSKKNLTAILSTIKIF